MQHKQLYIGLMGKTADDFEYYILKRSELDNVFLYSWDFNTLSAYKEQHLQLRSTLFVLVEKGELSVEINHIEYRVEHTHIVLLSFGHSLKLLNVSMDFKGTILYIRKDFVDQMYSSDMIYKRTRYGIKMYRDPVVKLEYQELRRLISRNRLIRNILQEKRHLYQTELLLNALRIFFLDLSNIIEQKKPNLSVRKLSMEEIYFQNFLDLIQEHYKRQHTVEFYANQVNITPHYLTIIVKRLTGETVSEFIYNLVFSKAKHLLNEPNKTIQQIAEELNFSDQSAFGKFFKRRSGLSPKQYRTKLTS